MTETVGPRWPWRIAVTLLIATSIGYLVVLPAGQWLNSWLNPPRSGQLLEEMSWGEMIQLRIMEALCAAWFFSVGATIGSFLNVLVHRLPRGESVIWQRSRCPSCGSAIAARDNLPLVGWLRLGGRCRSCAAPISTRYPFVELTMAMLVMVLYFAELLSGGANIPERVPNFHRGVVWILFYAKWDLIALFLFHGYLVATLLTWALLHYDGQSLPRRSWSLAIGVAILIPVVFPWLHPVPIHANVSPLIKGVPVASGVGTAIEGLLTGLVGAAYGMSIGALLRVARVRLVVIEGPATWADYLAPWGLIGAVLGWQAAGSILPVFVLIGWSIQVSARHWSCLRRWPLTASLLVATLTHQLAWRAAVEGLAPWVLSVRSTSAQIGLFTGVLLVLVGFWSVWGRVFLPLRESTFLPPNSNADTDAPTAETNATP